MPPNGLDRDFLDESQQMSLMSVDPMLLLIIEFSKEVIAERRRVLAGTKGQQFPTNLQNSCCNRVSQMLEQFKIPTMGTTMQSNCLESLFTGNAQEANQCLLSNCGR